jgi:protein SCO1
MSELIKFLPDVNLTNENNEQHSFHELIKGKTIILNMFYSNCKIKCVPLGNLMRRVNLLLSERNISEHDVVFISITLDAKNDTPEDLTRFKNMIKANECTNWHFYTGDFDEIEKLRFKLGMYNPELEIDVIKSNHSGSFMIFNTLTGFTKHTNAFDNPIDIARKVLQMTTKNFKRHSYTLDSLNYCALSNDELFENIHSMNSMFTVPFLPEYIRNKYDDYAEKQRGFQYEPPIENPEDDAGGESSCCCCKK